MLRTRCGPDPVRALLSRLDVLIASSTAPSTVDVDLMAAVRLAHQVRGNATRASQERSQRIEVAVEAEDALRGPCIGMKRRAWLVRNGIGCRLEKHELGRVPSDRIVRHYLRLKDQAATVAPSPEATRDPVSTRASHSGDEHGGRVGEGKRI